MVKLWSVGLSAAQIAERTGYSKGAVGRILTDAGIRRADNPRKTYNCVPGGAYLS